MSDPPFAYLGSNTMNRFSPRRFNFSKTKLFIILLALVGIADTLLLLYNHFYTQGQCQVLPFGLNNILDSDCGTVTNSSYGTVVDFPLSLWGLIGYVLILTLTLISFWRTHVFLLVLLLVGFGMVVSYVLTWIQYSLIEAWCPLCITSTVLMSLIFFLSVYIFIYRPTILLNFNELLILILLMLSLSLGILLTYKIFEDFFQNPNTSQTTSTFEKLGKVNDMLNTPSFPAALINKQVIDLKEIDYELATHFNPASLTILRSKADLSPLLYSLRQRALYSIALKKYAESVEQNEDQIIIDFTEKNITKKKFSDGLLATTTVTTQLQDNTASITKLLTPTWYSNFITNISKAINIQENIPLPSWKP